MNLKIKVKSIFCVVLALVTVVLFCSCDFDFDFLFEETQPFDANGDILTIHYLDVGQGDSIFIELPTNETMLIDASVSAYGKGISKYIQEQGYNKIDYLIATHPHADHIGGMRKLIQNLEVGKIYMPKATATTNTYKKLLTEIQNKGLKINTAKAGETIYEDEDLCIYLLAPNSDKYDNLNNYSAVIRIVYGNRAFLFMGDAEKISEKEITADVKADVLKLGHHGSSTSTSKEFLKKVQPIAAVASCGADNEYGHPHKETVELLENEGIEFYRTDTMGTIIATSDGNSLDITRDNPSVEKEN
ncbi:MAG: MBL fold metallo-hydrolase [Ruminococcus sp.]|nr:MBL fold metallo-hydrolase [Ruminococcus sp.]